MLTGSRKKVANESGYRYNRTNQMAKGGNVYAKGSYHLCRRDVIISDC